MKKNSKKTIQKNAGRFFKKFLYRLASKVLEIAALIGIGSMLGLHLVRY